MKAPKLKTIVIAVICLIVLMIPTYLAVIVYKNAVNNPVTERAVAKMVLTDPDGKEYVFEKGKTTDCEYGEIHGGTISFFIGMHANAEKVSALPAALNGTDTFRATYYSYNLENVYTYYFSTDASAAYYVDAAGSAYHIARGDAEVFVNSLYALSLYKEAQAPVMTLGSDGTVIVPQSMTWRYQLTDSEYANAVAAVSDEKKTVTVAGLPQFKFSRQPDYLLVQIYRDSELIFNDLYSNLTTGNVDFGSDNATLSVAVTAQWYQNEDYSSYGEAYYNFIMDVRAPSAFYLGETTVEVGEFVVISGKNVTDPSAITFTSSPEINFTPVFFAEGDYVYALVPISYELEYSPSYTFTLDCEGVQTVLTLNVEKKTFRTQASDIDSNIIVATRTQATLDAFAETMSPLYANQLNTRYWKESTKFTEPVGSAMVKTGFGLYVSITATGTVYQHEGVNFVVNDGQAVYAACGGEVIFVGTTSLSGRTVVIDHGFGLKTMYCHMSATNVGVGDVVNAGDTIGVVGSTGFVDGTGFHFGMYVFDTPVSPYDALWENGIVVAKP